jgi:hypothetical protein
VLKTFALSLNPLLSMGLPSDNRLGLGSSGTFGIEYAGECATHQRLAARSHRGPETTVSGTISILYYVM